MSRIGICTFSCHQHWLAIDAGDPGVRFTDAPGFYRYARELGAEGVQTPLRPNTAEAARRLRTFVEETGGYFEAELRLPDTDADLARFADDVRLAREAGAAIARSYFTLRRRYEAFDSPADFETFREHSRRSLQLAEPVLRHHHLKLAIENHKDFTSAELIVLLQEMSSEWIGAQVDTGNNLSLLEDPYEAVETLAPWALSAHVKDMMMQPTEEGFLLSEVPVGAGCLDLPRMVATLRRANRGIALNLEMATRDPLPIPCRTERYYAALPAEYRGQHLEPALVRVSAQTRRCTVPTISGKPPAAVLAEEEAFNRASLAWMNQHLRD